jgi:hypothetical protein
LRGKVLLHRVRVKEIDDRIDEIANGAPESDALLSGLLQARLLRDKRKVNREAGRRLPRGIQVNRLALLEHIKWMAALAYRFLQVERKKPQRDRLEALRSLGEPPDKLLLGKRRLEEPRNGRYIEPTFPEESGKCVWLVAWMLSEAISRDDALLTLWRKRGLTALPIDRNEWFNVPSFFRRYIKPALPSVDQWHERMLRRKKNTFRRSRDGIMENLYLRFLLGQAPREGVAWERLDGTPFFRATVRYAFKTTAKASTSPTTHRTPAQAPTRKAPS